MTELELSWIRFSDAAFEPYLELGAGGVVLAALFYDEKPEVAYASVEVEREDGSFELVPGALAGLDEDEVGWCLQWTDEGRCVSVISSANRESEESVMRTVEKWTRERLDRLGAWQPADEWRLWWDEDEVET